MIAHISRILEEFRPCFTRQAAYHWFVTVVLGFIVRIEHCGASSFVRWLAIRPSLYTALLAFFRARSWPARPDPAPLVANRTGALHPGPNRRSTRACRRRHQGLQGSRKDARRQTVAPGVGQLRQSPVHLRAPLGSNRCSGRLA